ncbi:class I SAM-dependent methyltransferase [Marinitenerispora sediminis]|uniref:Phospholipid methyltransferase n=1 Tax=Marinitenerispora sediminis TaxID=1931232 RepID=A0A368TBE4_9ACTN|nr:methyltransferase [Marinitenerispora sediminis]RCV53671.1 phospholipid methyltransferase [Marinitenerispora sediminis]RCV57345.1 phospholipid methyltransferase [Marinitenerispora sediminis]RCV62375.1 phospholipid methyltransferase [Marinitenerispora sediminis]
MAVTQSPDNPAGPDSRLRDARLFLTQALQTFRATGSVVPSSPALAHALNRYVDERPDPAAPLSILESGSGTGPVSRAIAAHMRPGDTLDLVDPNPRFAEHLRGLLTTDPGLSAVADRVTVHESLVTDLGVDRRFDVIISGLPFANFTAEEVQEILDYYFTVLRPGGHLSFFGYLYTKQVKAIIAPRADYLRQVRSGWVVDDWVKRYGVGRERVFANVPPAWIFHLRKPLEDGGGS